jgi:iron complex outermembrane receptor protein
VTHTNDAGEYQFTRVPNGNYTVSFSLVGFAPAVHRVFTTEDEVNLDVSLATTVVELPPIQITATPSATTTLTSPQPASVVTGEELRLRQAANLGATLDGVTGVTNWSTGAGIGKPVIRGLSSNRVLIVENGQRVEHQAWGDEHSPTVETGDAERIEVVRGPSSVMYGSDAIGGVVNVVPRELPDAIDRSGFIGGWFTGSFATNNEQPQGTLALEGASGGFGARASVSGLTSNDLRTAEGTLFNSANRSWGGQAAAGYRGSWGSVSATYSARNEEPEIHEDPAEDPLATPFQKIGMDVLRIRVQAPVGRSRLEVIGGYSVNDRQEFEARDEPLPALTLREETGTGDVRWHHAPIGPFTGTLGISYRRDQIRTGGEEVLVPASDADNVGLYASEQMHVDRWTVGFGLRYEYRQLDVFAEPALGVVPQQRTYNTVSGNVGVSYRVSSPVALVVNVGRGFRAPSTFELFADGVHEGTNRYEIGDPNLDNETSLNTDLAVRVQTPSIIAEMGVFANVIDNYIYPDPTGMIDSTSGLQIFDITQGNSTFLGAEAALTWHTNQWLHFRGTADYVWAENQRLDQPLPWIPPFRATYWVQFEGRGNRTFLRPWIAVGGETNAKQTRTDPEDFAPPGYTLMNAAAGVTVDSPNGGISFDLTLRNALDKDYIDFMSRYKTYALNMGRNLTIRITTAF